MDKDGKEIEEETTKLSTGMIIKVDSEEENEKQYVISIIGDVNGDGEVDFQDILEVNKHRLDKEKLEGVNLIAGDVNEDEEASKTSYK